ncbi:MAG: glycosyltransferase [Lewinellaceae bacterium]|nr:glycosyltransferase [Lewinellaceae bacterium]
MAHIALFIWLFSLLALVHTYVLYPFLLRFWARNKPLNPIRFAADDQELPFVSVLMSVYNEEKVMAEKMKSLLDLHYPADKLRLYIGSDCSSDNTHALIAEHISDRLHFVPFEQRRGKPPVINDLAAMAFARVPAGANHVLLLTDASVMLEPEALYRLVRHFKNPGIGVVDACMLSTGTRKEGISQSEERYIGGELQLKSAESRLWGKMIGPFGGCYAMRSDLFEPIPPNSLVDDFYLVFRALEKGAAAINDLDARCYEGATHKVRDEFRRKKRIAAGSFQNLQRFGHWVLPPTTTLGFAFLSHKVLRWLGGFFIILAWLSNAVLAYGNQIFRGLFVAFTLGLCLVPLLNWLLNKFNIHHFYLKSIAYFLAMNAALVAGFLNG